MLPFCNFKIQKPCAVIFKHHFYRLIKGGVFLDKIKYSVNIGKRKNFYITISKGNVLVKAPLWAKEKDIETIIEKKKNWIIKNVAKSLENQKPPNSFSNGDQFFILGEKCFLKENFINCGKCTLSKNGNILNVFLPTERKSLNNKDLIEKCFSKWYKNFAENEITESFNRMSKISGISANKLTIRKMTRSWGRCSSKFNISINREVACYSKKSIDYVVLHELCHIVHFNHSKAFWELVEKFMPDYKIWKENLKTPQYN